MGDLHTVNGTRIFVDDRGTAEAPALLFIHGGPGNPCWDFMVCVGDLLARELRVIGVDQRGVLRSDALPDGVTPSIPDLIADFESLREQLDIERWTILGHSAGGAYALDYALAHPESIAGAIFDCPCWDGETTDRYRLPRAADLADALGKPEAAAEIRALVAQPTPISGGDESRRVMQGLGDDYLQLLFHDEAGIAAYHAAVNTADGLGFDWGRGVSHMPLLADMYTDRRPSLAALTAPTMLIHGADDLVAPPDVIAEYAATTGGAVHTIERAGHFPFIEQPEAYAALVSTFVRDLDRATTG